MACQWTVFVQARRQFNLIINNDEFVPLGQYSRNMQMTLRTDNGQKM
jgi:hypothetical protein